MTLSVPSDADSTRADSPDPAAGSTPKLVFRTGASRGKVFLLEKDRLTLGRDKRNDIVLGDDIVSSRHVIIGKLPDRDGAAGTYSIQDAGSKNGTFLNGRVIESPVTLREGDVFCLARSGPEVQFTYGDPSLPSLLSTSTATFVRTRSIDKAFRELLPRRFTDRDTGIVRVSGVRELIDLGLEKMEQRSRRFALCSLIGVAAVCVLGIVLVFLVAGPGRDRDTGGGFPGTVVNPAGGGSRGPAAATTGRLRVRLDLAVEPIYGSLFHSYRENPIGNVDVVNEGASPLRGARLEFDLYLRRRGRMDSLLMESFDRDVPELAAGATWPLSISPVLSDNILSTRDHEVTAEVRLQRDGQAIATRTKAVMVYGRRVINWNRPKQIAAFIDSEDPVVRAFVNASWPARPEVARGEFPPPNTVSAVTVLSSLADMGLRYLTDPQTPSTFAGGDTENDRVKYPGETLRDGTGDCDDLSVLCCSVLKAVGVPTVFVVGTDHVLFMFDSGFASDALRRGGGSPFDPETVVIWNGRLWIPIESTSLARQNASFLSSWSDAWKRKEAIENEDGEMTVVDIQEAWKKYRPLRPEAAESLTASLEKERWVKPDLAEKISRTIETLRKSYLESMKKRVQKISEECEGFERDRKVALLYAEGGLYSEAREVFEDVIFSGEAGSRAPRTRDEALAWRGELTLEKASLLADLAVTVALGARSPDDYSVAAGFYELALRAVPEGHPGRAELMMRLALIYRLSGDVRSVKSWTSRAFSLDPSLEPIYRDLIRGDGAVAADTSILIVDYLERSFRRP